jgi:hypothetical protein
LESTWRPSRTTAAAVSSQEDSIQSKSIEEGSKALGAGL